jgi:hypothetical protein
MAQLPSPGSSKYGPEYGSEAIRRLEAGFSVVYDDEDGTLVEEFPDGRRFAIDVKPEGVIVHLREMTRVAR